MKKTNHFLNYLTASKQVILDGALATELQNRGCDLNDPLWSAKVLCEDPQLIKQVHYDYFVAGADCAITASYQATPLGFAPKQLSQQQAINLIKLSVELAKDAKQTYQQTFNTKRPLFIAGSVGPYGAYLADGSEYRGDYDLPDEQMQAFHYDRIKALIDAGVDVLAFETIPSFNEVKSLTHILQQFPNIIAWFSFTLKDEHHLSDGTPLNKVLAYLNSIEQVVSVGINCIALEKVSPALATLQTLTHKPLIVYPNSGEHYDPHTKQWHKHDSCDHTLAAQAKIWQAHGAKIIGGCCRTTPEDIKQLVKVF